MITVWLLLSTDEEDESSWLFCYSNAISPILLSAAVCRTLAARIPHTVREVLFLSLSESRVTSMLCSYAVRGFLVELLERKAKKNFALCAISSDM